MSRAAAFVMVLLLSPWAAFLASADAAAEVGGFDHDLPSPRAAAAAVWTGTKGYVFGGALTSDYRAMSLSGHLDEIVLHDPDHAETRVVARLPSPRAAASAVWTGEVAYVFGGIGPSGPLDEIVRFDPRDLSVTVMPERLPGGRFYASAVWADGEAYLFGGITLVAGLSASVPDILRYRPAEGGLETMGAQLDREQAAQAAVWVDGHAYLFGGVRIKGIAWEPTNAVRRYDIANDTLTTVAGLSRWTIHASAFWDGSAVRVLGGYDPGPAVFPKDIYAFDPPTSQIQVVGYGPTRSVMPVVWTDTGRAYGYGGFSAYDVNGAVASILEIVPPKGIGDASRNVAAPVVALAGDRLFAFAMAGDTVREMNLTTRVERVVGERPGLFRAGAASDGASIYLFGGANLAAQARTTDIHRFDPHTHTFERMNASLASGRYVHALWTGADFLLVSAEHYDDGTGWLHRYDPVADTLTPVASPPIWTNKGAVWADGVLLVWGDGRVTRFDPATGNHTQSAATFRHADGRRGAFWDGTQAYLFGGRRWECDPSGEPEYCYEVWEAPLRYDPVLDTITIGASTRGRMDGSALWAGDRGYVVGGHLKGRPGVDVVAYHVAPGRPEISGAVSPQRVDLSWSAAISNGSAPIEEYRIYRVSPGPRQLVANAAAPGTLAQTGLEDNATYVYDAVAVSAAGEGAPARIVLRTPALAPGAPASLTGTRGPGVGEITLQWETPLADGGDAVTGYRVYGGPSPDALALVAETEGLSFVHAGLAAGATWHYEVRARNGVGEGPAVAATARAPSAPVAPASIEARRGSTADSIEVAWEAPSDDGGIEVAAYRVYGGDAPDALMLLAETTARTFVEAGLPLNTVRHYQVSAVNAVGEGAPTLVTSGATSTPPSEPRSVATAREGVGALRVSWREPLQTHGLPVLHYRVYGGPASDRLALLGQSENLSFRDEGLAPGVIRYYRVSAVTAAGEGTLSLFATGQTATVPGSPRNVEASQSLPPGSMLVRWSPPGVDGGLPVTGYRVWRSVNDGPWEVIATTAETRFVDRDRAAGSLLRYQVSALNEAGEGARSSAVTTVGAGLPG